MATVVDLPELSATGALPAPRPAHVRPARVLFPFEGGIIGGSHVSALMLAAGLDRRRYEPVVLLHHPGGQLADYLAAHGIVPILAAPGVAPTGRADILLGLGARARFLKQAGIDIVHSNEGLMHVMWGLAAALARVPSIWHHRGSPDARGLRLVAPFTADRVIAVSRFAAPRAGRLAAAGRTRVIPSPFETGADLAEARAGAARNRAGLGVPADALVLGFFAQLSDRKRPIRFVEAVAAARARMRRPVVGLIFGDVLEPRLDGALDDAIQRHGLQGEVRRMGFRRPIEPWIAACDANIVTAVDEPFGRTLIEAMLIGTPVIATRSGGNIEAIRDGETGLLVPPDDPDAMAAAIARLDEPGLAERLSGAARQDATDRFGVDCHVRAVSDVYAELLAA